MEEFKVGNRIIVNNADAYFVDEETEVIISHYKMRSFWCEPEDKSIVAEDWRDFDQLCIGINGDNGVVFKHVE